MTGGRDCKAGFLMAAMLWTGVQAAAAEALTGDPETGKKVFKLCMACHSVEPGQNRLGPTLHNVIGREAGSIENFNYSKAHKESGIVWTPETLDPYLKNPAKYIPNNRMAFVGIKNDQQRADLIAYLASDAVSPDAPSADEASGGTTDQDGE